MTTYTPEENEIIRDNYGKVSTKKLGELLGRSWKSVHERTRRLGLIKEHEKVCPVCGKLFFSRMGALTVYCSMPCARRANYLKDPERVCRNSREHQVKRRFKIPKTFSTWSDPEIRKLWEEYKGGRKTIEDFAKSHGYGLNIVRELFRTSYPDEWADEIERRKSKSKMYQKGRAFEYRIRDLLTLNKFWVLRSPQSKSPADLCALKRGRILLVQCKVSKSYMKARDWEQLATLADSVGAEAVLAYRNSGKAHYQVSFEYRDGSDCVIFPVDKDQA